MQEWEGKILGVIGGMGPLATQLFYKMVIELTDAHADREHINMILLNHATMPDRTEAILTGDMEPVFTRLCADGKMLAANGACAIAIPCNTAHYWIERLQEALPVPVLNMVREGVNAAAAQLAGKEPAKKRVGILGTDGTVRTELYQAECRRQGLTPVTPGEENQRRVMKIIYEGIKNGGPVSYGDFERIEAELAEENCGCAILACTELSCFKEMYHLPDRYIDAMEALARRAVVSCGKSLAKTSAP